LVQTQNRPVLLYGVAAAASLVAVISGVGSVPWSRLGVWLTLALFFALMALFPAADSRPLWARWTLAGLLFLSLGLLVLRYMVSG
jgi:hypothetical protein